MTGETERWFAGVDLRSEKHKACMLDEADAVVGERACRHDAAGLAALCTWLMSSHAGAVPVATEVPHGPVVDMLLDRCFAMYAINQKQLGRLRNCSSLAGAKGDGGRRPGRGRRNPHQPAPVPARDRRRPGHNRTQICMLAHWSRPNPRRQKTGGIAG
jgi:hypothetical protein